MRKSNLDDLDGALSGMINANVKTVAKQTDERRFVMNDGVTNSKQGIFASHMNSSNAPLDTSGAAATHTSDFEKHQVNYSATKYIKP